MRAKLSRLLRIASVATEHLKDSWLFLRHNGFSPFEGLDRRLSHKTVIEAHAIEKGLSLQFPKPYFGAEKIDALLDMDQRREQGQNDLPRGMLTGALRDYQARFPLSEHPKATVAKRIHNFLDENKDMNLPGGVRPAPASAGVRNPAACAFLHKRFSARVFGSTALTDAELDEVLSLAQRAPSQCNRQSVRVHAYRDRQRIDSLLALQGGARGFSEIVPTLFVVTSEITAWGGPQQRNQPYVDGGIFTTMFLLALDACGFVCCPLNLAIYHATERKIKQLGNIPERERLVVMVAAGPAPKAPFNATVSPRWPVDIILTKHD